MPMLNAMPATCAKIECNIDCVSENVGYIKKGVVQKIPVIATHKAYIKIGIVRTEKPFKNIPVATVMPNNRNPICIIHFLS